MKSRRCKLPYDEDALEPYISRETVLFHYDKHHASYADKLETLVRHTEYDGMDLESIIDAARRDGDIDVLNNAAQVWNHNFFWQGLSPAGSQPTGAIKDLVDRQFGGVSEFRQAFTDAATSVFGSGWVWLVIENGDLKIVTSANAETPVGTDQVPLLALDVWEHAYYIDYRNRREAFAAALVENLVNWKFVAANLEHAMMRRAA